MGEYHHRFSSGLLPFSYYVYKVIAMELIRKSLNAPVPYTTIYHSGQKMHISVLNGALWDIGLVHCAICEFSLFQ